MGPSRRLARLDTPPIHSNALGRRGNKNQLERDHHAAHSRPLPTHHPSHRHRWKRPNPEHCGEPRQQLITSPAQLPVEVVRAHVDGLGHEVIEVFIDRQFASIVEPPNDHQGPHHQERIDQRFFMVRQLVDTSIARK